LTDSIDLRNCLKFSRELVYTIHMNLKSLKDIDIKGKTVLYRSPYDIGVKEGSDGGYVLKDDSRIVVTLPTLEYLREQACKIVILTWVKRPEGKIVEKLRTTPHAKALSELLGVEVKKVDDCVGEEVQSQVANLGAGELLMLENVRFYPEEDVDDDEFAKNLSIGYDLVVFDGFPQAHRVHSSTTGILRHLPGVAGLYLEKEVSELEKLIRNPAKPFTVVIGGAKVSDKVDAVNSLIEETNYILVGGGTANVFLKASGYEVGDSFLEDAFVDKKKKVKRDWVEYAGEILGEFGDKIMIPEDVVISDGSETRVIDVAEGIPAGWKALDIGPKTTEAFSKIINNSKTVFWNGPMGVFENEGFEKGSAAIAQAMEKSEAVTVISGGDTVEAAKNFADTTKITHLSLAGGASLEFLAGKELLVLKMLME
jgi:phosphoglycerate kinase